jgi:1-aminocyclopropane-1-carboxylate deaminase/D-cysteine desulfhydrase-like pyridoxal-dependent ACC family enzyme
MAALAPDELQHRIDLVDRLRLGAFPTPLQELPRFAAALGGPRIFIKRDDLSGLGYGGNKIRKLEFSMAELVRDDVQAIVSGAYTQSNFVRQASAAANKLGMKPYLLLIGPPDSRRQGNLLMDDILGAEIEFVDARSWTDLHVLIEQKAQTLRDSGVRARGLTGFEATGAIGYVEGLLEMLGQCEARGFRPDHIFVCSGTGTQAGLEVAARAIGWDVDIVGVSAAHTTDGYPSVSARLTEVANWVADRLSLDLAFETSDIFNTPDYVGEAYGQLTSQAQEAIWLLAQTEGLFVDPCYTGKALAGLVDYVRSGKVGAEESVVFVHTGGTPALFAHDDEVVRSAAL